jgi:mono/diheme cytochrome c family protein/glucose/arabinose dehydrogenase
MHLVRVAAAGVAALAVLSGHDRQTPTKAPVLSAADEMKTFVLPPGYRVELVASEPLVIDPIAIDFDADGRLWVLEMPGFMSAAGAQNSREPINNVVVLEDRDGDGVMDHRIVFADKLVLPRALKVLDRGVLVAEPTNLWLMKDTDGDLRADTRELVSDTYGRASGTIEHNANSLVWALDNVIYTSEHDWHLRLKHGTFEIRPALQRGQWGATMDDAGRVYRNFNDAPLFVDAVAAHYYVRNPNLVRTRGLYEPLISREESVIWPVRQTRGVNRGYRDQFFRPDGSSVTIQGAGSPVIYRGDQLPRDLYGDAFITDSTTNLVHRYKIVDDGTGRLHAVDGYAKGEILASSDERFRPVNLLGGPDGALYVVDMYRGVVQEVVYWTDYLREYVEAADLERPVHLGRIWRIVHERTRRQPRPALAKAAPAELVRALSHPNGWWRDTAQRLLVERGDKTLVPLLKPLAASAPDWRTRLHALWTLDGIDALDMETVRTALGDKSADVRAAAVRLSERWIKEPGHALATPVLALMEDRSWTVRRQVAATIGELPEQARLEPALAMLLRYGADDAVTVDAAISGLRANEAAVLGRVQAQGGEGHGETIAALAGAVARSGDVAAVERLLGQATNRATPDWQKVALLRGLADGLPGPGAGRGGRGRGAARGALALPKEPAGLATTVETAGEAGALAKRVIAGLDWPGKPAPASEVPPLTVAEQQRFAAGAAIYANLCVACHQSDGRGRDKLAPALAGSAYAAGADAGAATRILLAGKESAAALMPPLGATLNDEQMAAVLTYIRREWGNTGSPVAAEDVAEIRGLTRHRTRPWTDAELQSGRGRGR